MSGHVSQERIYSGIANVLRVGLIAMDGSWNAVDREIERVVEVVVEMNLPVAA